MSHAGVLKPEVKRRKRRLHSRNNAVKGSPFGGGHVVAAWLESAMGRKVRALRGRMIVNDDRG